MPKFDGSVRSGALGRIIGFAGCIATIGSAAGATMEVSVTDGDGRPVSHAVVFAEPVSLDTVVGEPTVPRKVIRQQFQRFDPSVVAVGVGTTIEFPNFDRMRHHVYSFSEARRFEIRLYSGESVPSVTFDKPGIVVIGCNIHDWMEAWIYVTDAPYYTTSAESGIAKLMDMDPGEYVVSVWHPGLTEPVRVPDNVSTEKGSVAVTLSQSLAPPSQERPRNELLARFEIED